MYNVGYVCRQYRRHNRPPPHMYIQRMYVQHIYRWRARCHTHIQRQQRMMRCPLAPPSLLPVEHGELFDCFFSFSRAHSPSPVPGLPIIRREDDVELPGRSEVEIEYNRGGQRYVLARATICVPLNLIYPPDLSPGTQEHGAGPRPRVLAAVAGITAPGCGHEVKKGTSSRTHF